MVGKKGFAPVIIILIVLLVSSAIVYYITRNLNKAKADTLPSTPVGNIVATPTSTSNAGTITLTATGVQGANGAQVDNVRYYLLNPVLASGNNWGQPDWCSIGSDCKYYSMSNTSGQYVSITNSTNFYSSNLTSNTEPRGNYGTYDLSQSSDPSSNYKIVWDKNTHSSGSTTYSRALSPTNIPPGYYYIGLRVQDVNGNVNGSASTLMVTITDSTQATSCSYSYTTGNVGTNPSIIVSINSGAPSDIFSASIVSTVTGTYGISGSRTGMGTIALALPPGPGNYIISARDDSKSIICSGPANTTISGDIDNDGFANALEASIGTNPLKSCSLPGNVNAWPPDVNNDGIVNLSDVIIIQGKSGTKVGDANYNKRYDLNADGVIDINDLNIAKNSYMKKCTPGT